MRKDPGSLMTLQNRDILPIHNGLCCRQEIDSGVGHCDLGLNFYRNSHYFSLKYMSRLLAILKHYLWSSNNRSFIFSV